MRGADLLVATLANAGVDCIFTLSGNQIMPVFDACIDAKIRMIHVRHEAAAVYMAEAYSQLTGQTGVALVTAAPGFGNALGSLYMAGQAENPVLLLSGDSPTSQDGKGAFQELDQVSVSRGLTKLSRRCESAEKLGSDTVDAIRAARSGRPGPVHLALPFDVLNASVDSPIPEVAAFSNEPQRPDDHAIQTMVQALSSAARPVIITGPALGSVRTGDLVEQLSNAAAAPVITMQSPRGLNDPSLGSFSSAIANADLIISLGKRFDFTTGFGQALIKGADKPLYLIDADTDVLAQANRAVGEKLTLAVNADPIPTAHALIDAITATTDRSSWRAEMASAVAARPAEPGASKPMRPAALCAQVQQFVDNANDPVVVIDGGEFGQWAQAFVSTDCRIINGPSGAIGGGLCYAIAAKIAKPESTVVLLMGDGTAGFHFAEFETAARYGVNIIAVIGHDAKWNAEVQIQIREYGEDRLNECELNPTRYDLAAAGLGCHGEQVSDASEVSAALQRSVDSKLPACLIAHIEGLPAPSAPAH
jgi:acetolactate synthase-1/2/3 large subunit